jgi:LPXTG-motif cell wall-anchored protein
MAGNEAGSCVRERRTMRRKALCAAAPACLLLGLSPLAAYAETPATPAPGTPAPAATASATAARVSDLIHISDTNARADATAGSAQATVLSVGGQALLGAGGSQDHEGTNAGSLLDTGTLPVHLQVAPWHTAVTGSSSSTHRHSHGDAALARAELPGTVKATVLGSQADADHTTEKSTATSTSDAADVNVADTIRLVLLHSEVNSVGHGHSFLIEFNGNQIGTDEALGKSPLCALDASVASLSCLTAAGGVGSNGMTSGNAEVAAVKTALGVVNPVDAFATAASSGIGTPPQSILPAVGSILPAETARSVTPAAAPAASLPRTGAAIASTLASGFAALVSGLGLSLFGRRRRRAA